jgi:hypothetical protein
MTLLHEPLPVSFRLNLHRPESARYKTILFDGNSFIMTILTWAFSNAAD